MSPRSLALTALTALATLAPLALSACGSARRGEPVAEPVELTAAEQHGERVFMRECHRCHPDGQAGLGPAINNKPLPAAMIRFQVREGVGAMPGFSDEVIPDQDLDALVVYLEALRRAPGPSKDTARASDR